MWGRPPGLPKPWPCVPRLLFAISLHAKMAGLPAMPFRVLLVVVVNWVTRFPMCFAGAQCEGAIGRLSNNIHCS